MDSSEESKSHQRGGQALTEELLAFFQRPADAVGDSTRLEELLDQLCSSDENLLTDVQVELRQRLAQYVKLLLEEKNRMDALREVYFEAMDNASEVGGAYYRDTATKLTELEAEGCDALEHQQYRTFTQVLETIKTLGDGAIHVLSDIKALGDRAGQE